MGQNLNKEDIPIEHMNLCFISYFIKEMLIKSTVGHPYTSNRMAKIRNTDLKHQMLVAMWSNRNSHSLMVRMQNRTATLEDSLLVPTKLNIVLIYDSATTLLLVFTPMS